MQLAFKKKPLDAGSAQKNIRLYKIWSESRKIAGSLLFAAILSLQGCSTPQVATLNPAEQLARDQELGASLARQFEAESVLREDAQISRYLEEIAQALILNSTTLRDSPVRVDIVKDQGTRWRNFGFPGTRLFLSRSLLRAVKFENELAAAVAFELAHVEKRNVLSQFEMQPSRPASLKDSAIFDFPKESQLKALESAMEMMYRAGFDPRGMALLFNNYKENPGHSPYDGKVTGALLENSWRIIALHAPLRNPIVRSAKFLAVHQRMKRL